MPFFRKITTIIFCTALVNVSPAFLTYSIDLMNKIPFDTEEFLTRIQTEIKSNNTFGLCFIFRHTKKTDCFCLKIHYSFYEIYATLYKKPRNLFTDSRLPWCLAARIGMRLFVIIVSRSGDVVFFR